MIIQALDEGQLVGNARLVGATVEPGAVDSIACQSTVEAEVALL